MNLATTAKEIGEGIGNKGLGFRSVEALTDEVQIFSRRGRKDSKKFDGYCFRFAMRTEIEGLLREDNVGTEIAAKVARIVPRYLVPLPLDEQPEEVVSYARRGYASVIVLPLRTAESIELASQQVQELVNLSVPLLLFLDRITNFQVKIRSSDSSVKRRKLSRRQEHVGTVPGISNCNLYEVHVGEDRCFLVAQYEVEKSRVLNAVEQSIPRAPQIKRWLKWKGQPTISVAVGLTSSAMGVGRLYNFLPMGDEAVSPLLGHVDAPFFADIDRRHANFDLPLNKMLMTTVAEACAYASLFLVNEGITRIPQLSVFDLVSWNGGHFEKLHTVFHGIGISLSDAPVIPVVPVDGVRWASLNEAKLWPADKFSLMKAQEVAKRSDVRLVSPNIHGERLRRLECMVGQYSSLSPTGSLLSDWSERFARSLYDRQAAPRTWSRFYEDLNHVFEAIDGELEALAGKKIILDSSRKLRPAGDNIFVHDESTKRRRTTGGVPFPPATLKRRYRFVDEKIKLRPDTLGAFVCAGLVQKYEPVQALAALRLGKRANDNSRRETLKWAFSVWLSAGAGIKEEVENVLQSTPFHVPTLHGWKPATQTMFSSSWTPTGQILESFLVATADVSRDCKRAYEGLLQNFTDWLNFRGSTKKQRVEFLKLLGVTDGLQPIVAELKEKESGRNWNKLLQYGDSKIGLDDEWCREVSHSSFAYPNTEYRREGEAWRLPGQIEHSELSSTGKEFFHELVFRHLESSGIRYITFKVGRFDRPAHHRDQQILPTPLAIFLKTKEWIAVSTGGELQFRKARKCWANRRKSNRLPQFVERVCDPLPELVYGDEEFADLVFSDTMGLRDWHSSDSAVERLLELADIAPSLDTRYRLNFRKEYQDAWHDVLKTDAPLPRELKLAVIRGGLLETLEGNSEKAPKVIVAQNTQDPAAKILSSAGHALLEVGGETSTETVAERLAATSAFAPCGFDGESVRLLVDGEPFVPRSSDPQLSSHQLKWLPDVVLLGHEILAERLERGVRRETVERRIRAIRLRRCRSISLVIDDNQLSSPNMDFYGFEHPELPTLILSEDIPLSWLTLSRDLSLIIQRLLDTRFRFLEPLLLRLFQSQDSNSLNPPSDEALAEATRCDADTFREHRASLRTDLGHVLHLLTPVVAYFGNVELARLLKRDAECKREQLNLPVWLESQFPRSKTVPADLIADCERASDRAELRRKLRLDYERFNRVLQDLGEPPLSAEDQLRSQYEVYLSQMKPKILERLRRRFVDNFREGHDLAVYVERKSLAFLEFNLGWVMTRELLDNETVRAHVARLLDEILGEDDEIKLPSLRGLLEKNRKTVREFASRAIPIVSAWCRHNGIAIPDPWRSENSQALTSKLENFGLLDFDALEDQSIPALCHRAKCWPDGMAQTLEYGVIGLDSATVEKDTNHRKKEHESKIIEERSIKFAGEDLDPLESSFVHKFQQLAERSIRADEDWFERSCRPKLEKFKEMKGGGRQSGGALIGRKERRRKKPHRDQRLAMGLVSEWLVLKYLRRRFGKIVDETCWVSRNRAHFFGGDEGDDSAGYDFCVKTPQAEWLYEVKSSLEDTGEFELTQNEMRVAASIPTHAHRKYRIFYVPFVFSPDRWAVLELPNPMDEKSRNQFKQLGSGSVRFQFEKSAMKRSM